MSKPEIPLVLAMLLGSPLLASVTAQLIAPASTIEVGQTLTFTATARDSAASATQFSYQFTVRPHNSGPFKVMQDYYWTNTFPWTPSDHEGAYDIGVTAVSSATHNFDPTWITVNVTSRVSGSRPVISNTNNALVALYSAPACSSPAQMRVFFRPASGSGPAVYTPYKACNGLSMNFYIGGMRANTTYTVQHSLSTGVGGPVLTHTTGSIPANVRIPNHFRLAGPQPATAITSPFLLHASDGAAPYATDLNENVVWYRPLTQNYTYYGTGYMTQPVRGGTFLTIDDDPVNTKAVCGSTTANCGDHQFLREYDLAGNVIRSTSWSTVNDQINVLRANQGRSQVRLNFFSHEAFRLPNGYTVTMATDEEVKNLKKSGTQDVFGDVIIALDTNWQVVWVWNSFDHLDINRITLPATCTKGAGGCPSQFFRTQPNGKPYTQALDWTHANSIGYDGRDQNLIVSFRHQSWVIKIGFRDGTGAGNIYWKFGFGGSFRLAPGHSVDEWPSGQHDFRLQPNGLFTLFDNNNASTVTEQPGGTAHGQAWNLDTSNMIATPEVNIDLGVVSVAVGSATRLSNGDYEWQAGFINVAEAQTFEFTPAGTLVYKQQSDIPTYRDYRMQDLYTPNVY